MKAQLGIPTGLALAVLSTLLATLFAMGVFGVAQARLTQLLTRSLSADYGDSCLAPKLVVTIALTGDYSETAGQLQKRCQPRFSLVSGSSRGARRRTSYSAQGLIEVRAILSDGRITSVTYTVNSTRRSRGSTYDFSR